MRSPIVACATLISALFLHAETPRLVRDISHSALSSWPTNFVSAQRSSYFIAADENGRELWKTDGTNAGTYMVRDIAPAVIPGLSQEQQMVISGDLIYFWAGVDGGYAVDLWRSDGTASGTVRLTNFGNDVTHCGPIFAIGKHGAVFAPDGFGPLEVTDGTPEGTRRLDLEDPAFPSDQVLVSRGVLYSAWLDELWRSDLTAAGTMKVATFGQFGDSVEQMTEVDGILYIVTRGDSIDGPVYSAWRSDGTEIGTRRIATFDRPIGLQPLRSQLFIIVSGYSPDGDAGSTEIWKSDGSEIGTTKVCALSGDFQRGFDILTATDGLLFLSVREMPSGKSVVWRSDGTLAGTWSIGIFETTALTAVATHNALFVTQSYFEPGLWTSTGGKVAMTKISPYWFDGMVAMGNEVVGAVYDDVHGAEPWISDGTPNGTRLVANIEADGGWFSGAPARFGKERALFIAYDDQHGAEPWITDGTHDGTRLIADIYSGTASSYPTGFSDLGNGKAVFCASEPAKGRELWVTDGSAAGTHLLHDFAPGPLSTFDSGGPFPVLDGKALISVGDLWTTDGTEAGTTRAVTFDADITTNPVIADHAVYANGFENFYKTDGTPGGTIRLTDGGIAFGVAGSQVVFHKPGYGQSGDLWATDGTIAGTHFVRTIRPSDPNTIIDAFPYPFTASLANAMYFFADDGEHGVELWRSDATEAGTHMVKDVAPGPSSSYVFIYDRSQIAEYDGFIYFVADDGVNGAELWRTDGTEAGTKMVSDIYPGSVSSFPSTLKVMFGRLYFSADDGVHGRELWSTDGVTTSMVSDLNPGIALSAPRDFFTLRDSIFFFATRDDVGRQLWKLDPTQRRRVAH